MKCACILALCLSLISLVLTGCQTGIPTRGDSGYTTPSQPQSTNWEPAQPEAVPAQQAAQSTDIIFKSNQLEVSKTILQQDQVGGNVRYRISIKALDDVKNVRVSEVLPTGIQFSSATPAANSAGKHLHWQFQSMTRGQTQDIDINVKPTLEGDHNICSSISVENDFCLNFFTGQPKLKLVKQGPSSIELGEIATWTVTVTNQGSAEATNVVVTDKLPDAFEATSELTHSIGTLAPGETRNLEYSAKAIKQGKFSNRAVASYDGDTPATAGESSAPIMVVQSGIRIRKSGPKQAYVFKPERFEITVENTGDTDLKNVRITDILPKGSAVANAGKGRVSGDAIGWMIPNLPAGASQLIATEVAATRKGESTNTVKVQTANGLEASDDATTEWLAVPGVTIAITDSKDPIREQEPTNYSIQVRNQGDFEPVSGTVTVTFTDSIKPTAVAGDAQGVINGQTVTFPRTTLEPGKDIDLSITAEGAKIGPGRAILNFSADFLNKPVISEEATNVY